MSEWQPIDTAPKDGSEFLATDGRCFDVCWMSKTRGGKNPRHECFPTSWDYDSGGSPEFTHWMPLPHQPPQPDIAEAVPGIDNPHGRVA